MGTVRRARKLRASTVQGTKYPSPRLRNSWECFEGKRNTLRTARDDAADEAGVAECPWREQGDPRARTQVENTSAATKFMDRFSRGFASESE